MLSFIIMLWIFFRLLRPRFGWRHWYHHYCYRPFFGLGWLPLIGLFLGSRMMRRPPYGEDPRDVRNSFNGRGPDGFGEPHGGNGWWF